MAGPSRTVVRNEVLGSQDAGSRVDRVLARFLPGVPRTRLFRLLRKGEVRLNGRRVSGESRVAEGDVLRVPPVRLETEEEAASKAGLAPAWLTDQVEAAIIHEDERLLVLDKPSGIAVHGGSGIGFGVIEALRTSRPDETLELVHRLDRDTSGCLMVARKRSTLRSMHAMLREEDGFDKRYLALLRGKWELGKKMIEVPLRTDTRVGGERTVKVDVQGKPAASEFRAVQFFGRLATLVEVRLLTGRTHQIRVHAAYAGHAVAGDEKYGDEAFNRQMRAFGLSRIFLHAHSIGFEDPDRHVDVSISAPLSAELKSVIEALTDKAGQLRPAGEVKIGLPVEPAAQPIAKASVKPKRPARAAPRKPTTKAGRSGRSGPTSRSSRTRSRRDPRT